MAKELFRPFHPDSYSGGGTFFTDGAYNVAKARWEKYTFNGKVPEGLVCLALSLEPVDKDGKVVGEAGQPQYTSITPAEAAIENDGKGIEMTGSYKTAWNNSDMGIFHSHLSKTKFMQEVDLDGSDISVLEGHIFEFGKTDSKRPAKEGGQVPKIIVPTTYIGKSGGGKKSGGSSKSKAAPEPAPAAASGSDELMEVLAEYLSEKVMISKNEKGIEKLKARMDLAKWLQNEKKLSQDECKAAGAMFQDNDTLGKLLGYNDWKLDGSVIKKG